MLSTFVTIWILHVAAMMSPGPNVLLVSQLAASDRARSAVFAALGVTCGAALWAPRAAVPRRAAGARAAPTAPAGTAGTRRPPERASPCRGISGTAPRTSGRRRRVSAVCGHSSMAIQRRCVGRSSVVSVLVGRVSSGISDQHYQSKSGSIFWQRVCHFVPGDAQPNPAGVGGGHGGAQRAVLAHAARLPVLSRACSRRLLAHARRRQSHRIGYHGGLGTEHAGGVTARGALSDLSCKTRINPMIAILASILGWL